MASSCLKNAHEKFRKRVVLIMNRVCLINIIKCMEEIDRLDVKANSKIFIKIWKKKLFNEILKEETRLPEPYLSALSTLTCYCISILKEELLDQIVVIFDSKSPSLDVLTANHIIFFCFLYLLKTFSLDFFLQYLYSLIINLKTEYEHETPNIASIIKLSKQLLLIFRFCGMDLRNNNPLEFKKLLIECVEPLHKKVLSNPKFSSFQIKFLLESILEIKENRTRLKIELSEFNLFKQNLYKHLDSQGMLVHQVEKASNFSLDESTKFKSLFLTKKHRFLNTELRKMIYCTLISASNPFDAVENFLKLIQAKDVKKFKHVSKNWMEEIVLICLYSCAIETKHGFNPYYSIVAKYLCNNFPKLNFIFKRQFFLLYECIPEEWSVESCINIGKFFGYLLEHDCLSLECVKETHINLLLFNNNLTDKSWILYISIFSYLFNLNPLTFESKILNTLFKHKDFPIIHVFIKKMFEEIGDSLLCKNYEYVQHNKTKYFEFYDNKS